MCKESYKRDILDNGSATCVKGTLYMWKDTHKRDAYSWKETHICEKRPISVKRDPYLWKETHICEKRPISVKRDAYMWKETHICEKRRISVKRDANLWKETHICEKRPISVKRDPYLWKETHKRPYKRRMNETETDRLTLKLTPVLHPEDTRKVSHGAQTNNGCATRVKRDLYIWKRDLYIWKRDLE